MDDNLDANDKAAVEADLTTLKEAINRAPIDAMTDDQINDIKAGKEKLMESAQKLLQRYMSRQVQLRMQVQQVPIQQEHRMQAHLQMMML